MAPVPPRRANRPVPSPRTIQEELKITPEIEEVDEERELTNQHSGMLLDRFACLLLLLMKTKNFLLWL